MLAMRGVVLTYETVREWCLKFGQTYANNLRSRSPRPGDRWHLDEVFLKINGRIHQLWRAVDQDGEVLDILIQRTRDKQAAKKFFRKLLKGLRYVPNVIECRTPATEVSEQPSREFTSANEIARALDETLQVTRARTAFPFSLRNYWLTLSSGAPSAQSEQLLQCDEIKIHSLGSRNRS